ncbi:PadR family transcriptional regulator [Clostridium sp. Marseille-P2415]|uniref:PadR family transcriptional regulator n=1 Tax=Clostridium sp. Marseille-P2415 TaxID=1805471 RepID=UPI000988568E|nr:PadR family transcriptional regulator [Clostridium sp. Marseille-P2415]
MSLSHSILGFLSYGSMTGYDLAKAFGSSVKFFWYAQTSHIYHELNKLEQKQFVTCEIIVQTEKPNKKLYSITESGKNEFLRWLSSENHEFSKGIKNAFLMKVFFSGCKPPDQCIAMLKSFSDDCKKYLIEMNDIPTSIDHYGKLVKPYEKVYWNFTADFGYSYIQMCIDWADRCIKKLEEFE